MFHPGRCPKSLSCLHVPVIFFFFFFFFLILLQCPQSFIAINVVKTLTARSFQSENTAIDTIEQQSRLTKSPAAIKGQMSSGAGRERKHWLIKGVTFVRRRDKSGRSYFYVFPVCVCGLVFTCVSRFTRWTRDRWWPLKVSQDRPVAGL